MPTQTPIIAGDKVNSHRNARLVLDFFNAYNTGRLDVALSLLDDEVVIGDCDLQKNSAVIFRGKKRAAEWLRQRLADRDQYTIKKIEADNDSAAVSFARRTSNALRLLGYQDGTTKTVTAKIGIKWGDTRIDVMALGMSPQSRISCYTAFGITPSP
jgi:hypothetical protein